MSQSAQYFSPAEAARRLGVSPKALRLYEQRGLVMPRRTAAGWRAYGAEAMQQGAEIVALRALGLSLAQIGRLLAGDAAGLEPVLAQHQTVLEIEARRVAAAIGKTAALRSRLAEGQMPGAGEVAQLLEPAAGPALRFELPWPWGGEVFELTDVSRITYIVGSLGSGKTRLAMRIAQELFGAVFVGLDRLENDGAAAQARLAADAVLNKKVEQALVWLVEDGATRSLALNVLLVALMAPDPTAVVVDVLEQGLDQPTQEALIGYLRRVAPVSRPLFAMTRSSSILDLAAVGANEASIFCPPNHSPPSLVRSYPGAPGYEAMASCLATPEVRARTAGTMVLRPEVA